MATSKEVQRSLAKFRKEIQQSTKDVQGVLEAIQALESDLETWNADETLDITRGIKTEIKKSKEEVDELRKVVKKLNDELSDTNRKYYYLAT